MIHDPYLQLKNQHQTFYQISNEISNTILQKSLKNYNEFSFSEIKKD